MTIIKFNASYLTEVRRKAMRKGIWFKTLNQAERAILNLVPKCVDTIKSPKLIDVVAKIIVKIKNALKSPIIKLMNQVGRPLAKKLSQIAQKWGNKNAYSWIEEPSYSIIWGMFTVNN